MNEPDVTEQPTAPTPVSCSAWLAAAERLRDRWCERANYLEQLAGYDTDWQSHYHKEHAKIIRRCISELYEETQAANTRI